MHHWATRARRLLLAMVVAGGLVGIGGVAYAKVFDTPQVLTACAQKNEGQMRLVSSPADCRSSENAVQWNEQGPPGKDATALWAVVAADGSLERGSSHVVSTARLDSSWGPGSYEVIFDQDVSACSYQVTLGEGAFFHDFRGDPTFQSGEATVFLRTQGSGANKGVFVQTLNSFGTAQRPQEFHVAVFC